VVSIPVPEKDLTFEDAGEQWAGAGKPALREPGDRQASGVPPLRADHFRPSTSPDEFRRQSAARRITVGAVAAIALVAILTAAILLAVTDGGSPKAKSAGHNPPKTTTTTTSVSTSSTTSTTIVTTTTSSPLVTPISTSGDDGTYKAPTGPYTLTFTATTSPCWVGVETGLGSGDYLWDETVQAGASQSYKATGPVAIVLGAPQFASVSLNGVPVEIPKGATAYNLVFTSA
jgi:hypothetical protein